MKSKKVRKEEAIERQKEYDKLTISQKLAKLDEKYGKDIGAKKVRAKFQKKLEKKQEK